MKEQWPSERLAEKQEAFVNSSFKTAQDFLALLNALPDCLRQDFDDIATLIIEQDDNPATLELHIARIVDSANLQTPDSHTLLITLACAAALSRSPSLHTWSKVSAFKFNSWQLEHWLGEAMLAYAEVHPSACNAYSMLAKEAFAALDNLSLQSQSDRTNKERTAAWAYWNERQDKLEEIWWGLRGWHGFMNYEEELPLFQVFYKLAPDEFICTISISFNPYLVSALLFAAGIGAFSPRFSEWKRITAAAPVAFEDGGKWNGSVLMPLLLVDARSQLLLARQDLRNPDFTPGELEEIKQEISGTAELIATALAARQDANDVLSRWTPWLMRQILRQKSTDISDLQSPAFADDALFEAIGRKLGDRPLPKTSPDEAPLWEAWCYRCVLASFAYNGHIHVPEWTNFGDEWNLSPEDWVGTRGHLLRERASLISTLNKETPGVAANLLAYPITQSPSPTKAWIGLWNDAIVLREIVEFGDPDAIEEEYRSRSEAERLLFLLFRIGLAIFDQGAANSSDNTSPEARSLASLFKALTYATYEMREIDNTLNHDDWLAAVQHLAVRRLIWESPSDSETASANFQIFKADDTPTVAAILADANGNVIELVGLLQSLLRNSPDISRLKANLNSASIDLSNVVQSIRSLNQYHQRKYPIEEAQLQKLGALI